MQSRSVVAVVLLTAICAIGKKLGHIPLQRHSTHLGARPSSPFSTIPAGGSVWPLAVYWCYIEVGTPPQRYAVVIDSGSPFLALPGKGCDGCATSAPNHAYSPQDSLTSRPGEAAPSSPTQPGFVETPADGTPGSTAHFHYMYKTCDLKHPTASCTIAGSVYQDKASIAGFGPVDVGFGMVMNQTRNLDQFKVINGLMGILPPLKGFADRNLFAALVAEGLCDNVWSMCLHEGSMSTGSLTLGGVDERLVDGPITYVKNTGSFYAGKGIGTIWMYGVHVNAIKFGEKAFKVGLTAILDSGTNILLLPSQLHHAVKDWMCANASLAHCKELWNANCQTMTKEQIAAYPHIKIELDGVALEMSPWDYILLGSPLAESADQYCIGIREGGDPSQGFMIGDTTLRNYYVVHDIDNRRIGWGKVNRETCGSVGDSDGDETTQSDMFLLGSMGPASGEVPGSSAPDSQELMQTAQTSFGFPALCTALTCALLFLAGHSWAHRTQANAWDQSVGHYVSIE